MELSKQLQEITLEVLKERVVGGFAHNLFGQELVEDYGLYCLNESDNQDAKEYLVKYCLFLKNKKVFSSKKFSHQKQFLINLKIIRLLIC